MKKKHSFGVYWFVIGICTSMLLFTGMAVAQDEESGELVLEDTVVTATKTGETDLQETPLSITAFDEESLKDAGMFRLRDLGLFVPNTEVTNTAGFSQTFIRGVGNITVGPLGGETNVSYYVDGVYIENGAGLTGDFIDIERIEVLRGPQGTLYGRNANGGAINFITKDPGNELEMKAAVDLGSFNKRRFDGSVSGPIAKDKVMMRLTVSDTARDGYLENTESGEEDPGSQDSTGVRAKVLVTPNDKLDITLSGDYFNNEGSGPAVKKLNDGGLMGAAAGYEVPSDFFEVEQNEGSVDETSQGVSGKIDFQMTDSLSVISITGYRQYEKDTESDTDGTGEELGYVIYELETEQLTQDLQLLGKHERLDWIGGFFYHQADTSYYQEAVLNYFAPGFTSGSEGDLETKSWALYTNLRYAATETVSMEAGVRYSVDEKSQEIEFLPRFEGLPPVAEPEDVSDSWESWTPRVAADWQPNEDFMLFASVATGYRAGDFFVFNPDDKDDTLEPEKVTTYELGVKKDWFDNRLRTNVTTFYSDYEDMQVVSGDENGLSVTENASSAEIKGVEFEMVAQPIAGATLNGSISYLDATYGDYTPNSFALPPVGESADGKQLFGVPKWKAAFGAQYVFDMGTAGFLTLRSDVAYKDKVYYSPLEDSTFEQDAYTIVNALIRYETADSRWSAELYGKNVTNEEYYEYIVPQFPPDDVYGSPGEPATYGFRVIYTY